VSRAGKCDSHLTLRRQAVCKSQAIGGGMRGTRRDSNPASGNTANIAYLIANNDDIREMTISSYRHVVGSHQPLPCELRHSQESLPPVEPVRHLCACTHACVHACASGCVQACACRGVWVLVCAWPPPIVCACAFVRACMCARACVRSRVPYSSSASKLRGGTDDLLIRHSMSGLIM